MPLSVLYDTQFYLNIALTAYNADMKIYPGKQERIYFNILTSCLFCDF